MSKIVNSDVTLFQKVPENLKFNFTQLNTYVIRNQTELSDLSMTALTMHEGDTAHLKSPEEFFLDVPAALGTFSVTVITMKPTLYCLKYSMFLILKMCLMKR